MKYSFILLLLLSVNVFSQHFRLDNDSKSKLAKIDKELLNKVLFTEHFLNEKSNPQLSVIENYITTSKISIKQLETFKKLVCLDCYKEEWELIQQNNKDSKDVMNGKNDSVQNIDYLKSLNKLDSVQVTTVANEINSLTNNAFKLYDKKKKNYTRILRFYPAKYTLQEFEAKYKTTGIYACTECMKVTFSFVFDGANSDLNVKGKKMYKFQSVTAEYLQLFPFWQKYVTPTLNAEQLLSDANYNNRWYKNIFYDINIRFHKTDNWVIENY